MKVRVVADADGAVLKSVLVNVGPAGDVSATLPDGRVGREHARYGPTDDQGNVVIDGVVPGRVAVMARLGGYVAATSDIDIVAGKTAEVTLRLVAKLPLAERLKKLRISFNLQATSLRDAVNFINTVHQLNVVVAPDLAERVRDPSITLSLKDVALSDALDAICREIGGAEYVVDEKSDVVLLRAKK